MVAWRNALVESNEEQFTGDWRPYGIEASEPHHPRHVPAPRAGPVQRRLQVEEVFAQDLLGT
ncbi:hypothetical protein AB0F91_37825 [Amycolatopsis sp. NPDC023774]|uniref:hypothetical protein n=1 Tax=Amycolatopsis sp. NPDC023774 TaxID=3155015 RepID=UPI0033C18161